MSKLSPNKATLPVGASHSSRQNNNAFGIPENMDYSAELNELLSCDVCEVVKPTTKMVGCENKHVICCSCVNQLTKTDKQQCPFGFCKGKLDAPDCMAPKKIFSFAGTADLFRTSQSSHQQSTTPDSKILEANRTSNSKCPIHCPHQNCNKTVAISSLKKHFQYEHRHIKTMPVVLEESIRILTQLKLLRPGIQQCLFFGPVSRDCGESGQRNRGQLSVDDKSVLIFLLAVQLPAPHKQSIGSGNEKVMLWLASNLQTNYSFTLALSTQCGVFRTKYFGPLNTLFGKASKLCSKGMGLMLPCTRLKSILEIDPTNEREQQLDFIIHEAQDIN